ncbi:MAG: hypothetical protein KC417_06840, partial [Myxococcales bacterium]|nr:hypothetical protein [Myxococcales bacterium]
RLEQPEEAVRSFARALALAPQHEGARGGLQALLEIDACRRAATDALADAFRRTDEWRGVLGLVDARLALAQNDVERVRILTDAASVVQTRGNDAEQAFDFIARAVPLAPENAGLTSDLLRLARATGRAGDAVPVLEAVLTELEAGSARVVELELELAELLERDLEDMPGAVARYAAALTTVPERRSVAEATLRTGGAAKDWARLAEAVLRHSATRGSLDAGLVEAVESNLATDDASGAFLDALDGAAADLSLDGKLAHDVALWRAELAESRVGDLARAKVALTQALSFEPLSRPALEAVVRLGRTNPDAGTLDALLRIASLDERNLDALADACETAADLGVPAEERERQLRRLYDRATVMWKDGMSALGERGPEQAARFALSSLVASLEARNAFGALASLASDAAQLPVDKTERHAWLARAAGAALRGGERDRAAGLYRTLLDEEPGHRSALDALAKLAEEDNRLPEMLSLRRTELALANDADRKLALRLDIVRLVGEIERQGGRVEALRTNLGERPGHIASIEALIQVLESTGRHAELADDLTAQAKHLENAGDAGTAARLWTRVATMAEYRLSDADRAVQAYRRVVELQATPQALDALARLRADSGDHASAAQWLERRLILATGDERAPIALRLAQEHFAADQRERAIKCLEIAFKESPSSPEIRDTLADAYRADKSGEQLAWVLTESSAYVQDHETLVRNAREATEL